jgi:hypothetical protein
VEVATLLDGLSVTFFPERIGIAVVFTWLISSGKSTLQTQSLFVKCSSMGCSRTQSLPAISLGAAVSFSDPFQRPMNTPIKSD